MNTLSLRHTPRYAAALLAALALGGIAASPAAAAESTTATHGEATSAKAGTPKTAAMSEAKYLNGGVGEDSQAAMRKAAHEWPLHITFSEKSDNAFVADVGLKVLDHAGKTVLAIDNAGPITYVKVSPGEYRIVASHKGKTLTRSVRVDHNTNVYFHWEG